MIKDKIGLRLFTQLDINLTKTVTATTSSGDIWIIQGETVVVEVDAITTKKDQTSTIKNISTDQIEKLAVEDLGAIVGMQAGVVEGHFRGGRTTEVTYLVDGQSLEHVKGATLDYKEGLMETGFSIDNPNVSRTCGCGNSFS